MEIVFFKKRTKRIFFLLSILLTYCVLSIMLRYKSSLNTKIDAIDMNDDLDLKFD